MVCVCVECSKQTENSEIKKRRVGVEHIGVRVACSKPYPKLENKPKTRKQKSVVCAWNVRTKPKTREQTQHSETKNLGVGVEHLCM